MDWFKEFLRLYFRGDVEGAYKYKYGNIPNRLYKFQPFQENRLSSVLNNKLWFTVPKNMNDPFDSRGVCWDNEELETFYSENISQEKMNEFNSINDIIDRGLASLRDNIKITCFSEELFSMPMWSHYADNHQGFCIEYNFSSLGWDNDLTKYLFPVGYETQRYNITNLFKLIFNEPYDARIILLFFLMNIKHSSWSYEREWRIIRMRFPEEEILNSGLEDCLVKPTAIYLGVNFNKDKIIEIKQRLQDSKIPIYALQTSNSQFFDMKMERI